LSQAAGFYSYAPDDTERFSSYCPKSLNYNYDVSPIAVPDGAGGGAGLVAGCYYWDSIYRAEMIKLVPVSQTNISNSSTPSLVDCVSSTVQQHIRTEQTFLERLLHVTLRQSTAN